MTKTVFLLIWMLIALSPLCYCYDAGNITNYYTPFNGGTNCGSHCPSGYTYMGDYACSDGRGAWNGGAFHFQDHIPSNQGYVLHKFSITIYLTYCNTSTVLILLGGMYCMCCQWCIGDGAKTSFRCSDGEEYLVATNTTSCSCPNCVVPVTFASVTDEDGLVGYHYQQTNTIAFQVVTTPTYNPTLCISGVELTLYYGPGLYQCNYARLIMHFSELLCYFIVSRHWSCNRQYNSICFW